MNPGSNLFNQASRLIPPTLIKFYKAAGRTQNASRQWIPNFAAAVDLYASVQSINRAKYSIYGLDFQKNYIKIFASANIFGVQRNSSGDRMVVDGIMYQVEENNPWFITDGWASCLAVEIPGGTPLVIAP